MPAELITGGDDRWRGLEWLSCPVAAASEPWVGEMFRDSDLIIGGEGGGGVSVTDMGIATRGYLDALHTIAVERSALARRQIEDADRERERNKA